MRAKLHRLPDAMCIRKRTVEYVFGPIKDWMGRSHLKNRRLRRARFGRWTAARDSLSSEGLGVR
jgi:hypothetical protein